MESKRTEEGFRLLQEAVRGRSNTVLVADDPNLAAFLAALHQRQGEHEQAIGLYQTLLQQHPNKGIWQMGLAISLEKKGEIPQALAAYRASLADESLSARLRQFIQTRLDHLK